jgi:hypothetical protein
VDRGLPRRMIRNMDGGLHRMLSFPKTMMGVVSSPTSLFTRKRYDLSVCPHDDKPPHFFKLDNYGTFCSLCLRNRKVTLRLVGYYPVDGTRLAGLGCWLLVVVACCCYILTAAVPGSTADSAKRYGGRYHVLEWMWGKIIKRHWQ